MFYDEDDDNYFRIQGSYFYMFRDLQIYMDCFGESHSITIVQIHCFYFTRCFIEQETLPSLLSCFQERIRAWLHNRNKIN